MPRRYQWLLLALCFLAFGIALASAIDQAHAAAPGCRTPKRATWASAPSGCAVLRPGRTATLPVGVTDVDVWGTWTGAHLRQHADPSSYPGCRKWYFYRAHGYVAGWVGCARTVYSEGRHTVTVYWWR